MYTTLIYTFTYIDAHRRAIPARALQRDFEVQRVKGVWSVALLSRACFLLTSV